MWDGRSDSTIVAFTRSRYKAARAESRFKETGDPTLTRSPNVQRARQEEGVMNLGEEGDVRGAVDCVTSCNRELAFSPARKKSQRNGFQEKNLESHDFEQVATFSYCQDAGGGAGSLVGGRGGNECDGVAHSRDLQHQQDPLRTSERDSVTRIIAVGPSIRP